ncbi:MAG: serine hydrolase [Terricaulis sp.]
MKKALCGGMLACFFLVAWSLPAGAQTDAPAYPTSRFVVTHPNLPTVPLRLRRDVSAILRGGEVHRYSLRLAAGQFATVRIQQLQGNLAAVVFDPDGVLVGIIDQNGAGLAEVVTIESQKAGEYSIQIAMFEWDAPAAAYAIEWTRRERGEQDSAGRAGQLFESWYDPQGPGAAVLVIQNGEIAYEGAIGIENTVGRRPISLHSPFELASISKQFTAYGIALLVERGQLSLSDDIRRYLPEMPNYGATITVQHLLEHTSGLRDWDGLFALVGREIEDGISADDVLAMAARQQTLTFTPGHEQRYSNTGYVLLAKIVERVGRQPFDRWAAENIFAPLGMHECGFAREPAPPARVASYRSQYPQPLPASTERLVTLGSSGLACSAHDLILWLDNYQNGRLGGEQARRLVTQVSATPTSSESDYVFGNWHSRRDGHAVVGHQGLSAGFRTSLHSFPDDHLVVIYLSNDGDDATYERVRVIENLFLGVQPPSIEAPTDDYTPAAPAALPNEEIVRLVGRYHSDELQAYYDINQDGQGIVARHEVAGTVKLFPQGDDLFSSDKWFVPSLTFVRDAYGRAEGFHVDSEDLGSLFFQRLGSN